ncbi:CLUMA_CG015486, isoform A [Clunio marinus]|uniref:CLUMA_CG015486, isoform A n=1 Tax=Clunio marinus TaxID=568069 RepID=A0A1J1IPI2_9DIPT|nr:CLUMA_CG015486, isoform A [Clunio marinus]
MLYYGCFKEIEFILKLQPPFYDWMLYKAICMFQSHLCQASAQAFSSLSCHELNVTTKADDSDSCNHFMTPLFILIQFELVKHSAKILENKSLSTENQITVKL